MSPKHHGAIKIVAPIQAAEDVERIVLAGADELYCGYLPQAWQDIYGDGDFLNKRQGVKANLTRPEDLACLATEAHRLGIPAALTLNTAYSREMLAPVMDIAGFWVDCGGDAVMVSDLALLMALKDKYPTLQCHLSILANTFNSRTIDFFTRFGIDRVVLPRELTTSEITQITRQFPLLGFEVMSLNDKCPFIDGLCHFYHATAYPDGVRLDLQFKEENGERVICTPDPAYRGHGCAIIAAHATHGGNSESFFAGNPGCAACFIDDLAEAGIGYLKLGGRGLPPEMNARNIAFLNQVRHWVSGGQTNSTAIKDLYRSTFGKPCHPGVCYYRQEG